MRTDHSPCADSRCFLRSQCANHVDANPNNPWHPYSTLNRDADRICRHFILKTPDYDTIVRTLIRLDMQSDAGQLVAILADAMMEAHHTGYIQAQCVAAMLLRWAEAGQHTLQLESDNGC